MATKMKTKADTDDFGAKPTKMFDLEHRTERVEAMLSTMADKDLIEKWEKQGEDEDTLLYHVRFRKGALRVLRLPTVEAFLLGALTAGADI